MYISHDINRIISPSPEFVLGDFFLEKKQMRVPLSTLPTNPARIVDTTCANIRFYYVVSTQLKKTCQIWIISSIWSRNKKCLKPPPRMFGEL